MTLVVRASLAWLGSGRPTPDVQVACEGGVITEVGRSRPGTEDGEVVVVDGFLMPAVADRHVHIGLSDPTAVLLGGVTAVRDLAWPAERIFGLADASEMPTYNGPLIRAAGPVLTAAGGYPTRDGWAPPGTGRELDGPEDAVAAVEELAGLGATAIKVSLNADAGPTPTDAELAAICTAAGEREIPVTAHAQGTGQVERALGAGVDELAHTPFTDALSEQVIQAMARSMRIVSTLAIFATGYDTSVLRIALDNLRRFHEAGGRVIYGTDLGNGDWGIAPGIYPREAVLLREAGLTSDEVLAAMVRSSLEPGAPADLIVLARDPLEDPEALRELRLVVRGGRIVLGSAHR
jgi:imidazolonepropionase-like amidohydrolase